MTNPLSDIKLERQAIITIFQDESLIDTLIKETDESYFTDRLALEAYRWMKERYLHSKRVSLVRMRRETEINMEELIEPGPNYMEYDEILRILKKLQMRRRLVGSAREILILADQEELEIEEYCHRAQEIIFNSTSDLSREKELYRMQEILDEVFTDIITIQEGKKKLTGLGTGFPSVDGHNSGLQPGHLTVIGGKSSMGKTAFALNVTHNILIQQKKVIIISLEMLAKEIGKRLLALNSLVPTSAYNRLLTESQYQNMNTSLSRLMKYNLTVSDRRGLRTEDIKAICRNVARKMGRFDLVIIDYLQRITLEDSRENLAKRVGNAVSSIRDMAGHLDVPVILISQLKRSNMEEPQLSDLRDSGEIEENADEVWFPFRKKYGTKDDDDSSPQEAKLIYAKGRMSGRGASKFIWYPSIQCWRDIVTERNEGPLSIIT